jgi:hypothetical protein
MSNKKADFLATDEKQMHSDEEIRVSAFVFDGCH